MVALVGVKPDGAGGARTEEMTTECSSIEDALLKLSQFVTTFGRDWHAITLVHIEDFPSVMDTATPEPGPTS